MCCQGDRRITINIIYQRLTSASSGVDYYLELNQNLVVGSWTNDGYSVTYGDASGEFQDVTNTIPVDVDAKFIQLIIEEN